MADALDFVHERGYLHRDVKPGNILFDAHGNAYLSDFGIAHASQDAAEAVASGPASACWAIAQTPIASDSAITATATNSVARPLDRGSPVTPRGPVRRSWRVPFDVIS